MKTAHLRFISLRYSLAVAAISLLGSTPAMAANLFWDGDGSGVVGGGAGTWNTTLTRWSTTSGGSTYQAWVNANVDSAEFGVATGTVNLGGPVVVNTITTTLAGYAIGNTGTSGATNTITFSGANAGVNTTTTGTTTINAVMSASGGLVKSGPGRLEMGNIGTSQPATNKYIINAGVISTASDARIGAAPGALVQDFITFNGGGWAITTGNQSTGANKGITIKSGGAFFGQSALSINLTIASPIVGTEGGGITLTNVGPFVGNGSVASGSILLLTNTSNSWDGNATIASGTLRVGAAGVIPDTAVVSLAAGTRFDLSNFAGTFFDETVKSISGTGGTVAVGTATLTVANPAGETHAGVISASAGGKVVKNGSGAWSLSGSSTGFNGEFVMNAGTLGVGASNIFGNAANTSTVTINGGTLSNTGAGGRTIPNPIAVNLSGDFSVDDSLFVGPGQILFNGPATIRNSNRTITVNGGANLGLGGVVGEDAAGRGIIKTGSGILAFTNAANTYSGDTEIQAGQVNVDGDASLGNGAGTVKLAGGRLNATANRTVATPNPVSVTANSEITTTSAAAAPVFEFSSNSVGGDGTSTLTLRNDGADAASDTFKPRFSGNGLTFSNPIVIDNGTTGKTELEFFNTGADQTFSGSISGNGSINRSASTAGTGTKTILTGANSYAGTTTIADGTLQVDGTHTGLGAYTVDANTGASATLQGNGSISAAVNVIEGTLSPGASIGSLATGALSFGATGAMLYEINSSLLTADLLDSSGSLSIAAGAVLNIAQLAAGFLPNGTKFTVISYNGTWDLGTFVGKANNSEFVAAGHRWRIKYDDLTAGSNFAAETLDNAAFVTLTAIPEASSIFGFGLSGLFAAAVVWYGKRRGIVLQL
jgi:autotransporter-associated beta strand protein